MSRTKNTPLLLALVVCMLVVAGVMIAAIFLAGRKPVVVVVQSSPPAVPSAVPAASPASAAATAGAGSAPAGAQPLQVTVFRVPAVPALEAVFDKAWDEVPAVEVPLLPQQVAPPMLDTPTVASVTVQAARDDARIAWRLSWPASRPAAQVETGRFADAVAIQVPMVDNAPFTMGAQGMPVRLLHWRAVWQQDIDKGFQDIPDLYPNAASDLYWFTSGDAPHRLASAFRDPRARQFIPALAAGNPISDFERKAPVEEIVAEGFGTATHVPDCPSGARGVWKDGRWTVVVDRPLDPEDPLVARLQSAGANMISFAVWDGEAANRGGRKHYCGWVGLRIEP